MKKFLLIVLVSLFASIYFLWITGYSLQDMDTFKFWIQAILYSVIINSFSDIIIYIYRK